MSSSSQVKFGAEILWLTPGDTFDPDVVIKTSKIGDKEGYDSLWVADHLRHLPGLTVAESWTLLTASSMVTTTPQLGTCVADPHRYHPAIMAQRLATIDHFSKGRLILGLGPGTAMNLAPFNIDMKKPVSKLVEYLEIIRKLWSGERFTHEGRFWQFNDAYLQIRPHQESIPVYFASNSPRMLRLTGKFADGWMPLGLTPKMYRNRLAQLKESARKSGRNIEDIDVGLYIGACMSENPDELAVLEGWKSLLIPDALIEAGYEIPERFRSFHYKDWELTPENMAEIADYASNVPSEATKDFFLMGNADECVERVDEYIKAGVKHFIFSFQAFDHGKMMEEFMNQVLTHFKI